MRLEILYQDQDLVAVNKPSGLLVHRTNIAAETRQNCMAFLRDQLGQWVYPIHRLDRATSGVLLFALSAEFAREMSELYQSKAVQKFYYAVVRGFVPERGEIDKPLINRQRDEEGGEPVPALSRFERVATVELPIPVGKYPAARYSLVRVEAVTGRYHQIRRHFCSISHPLVGDTVYGDGKHNRIFRDRFGLHRLLLAAQRIEFNRPATDERLAITAPWPAEFLVLFSQLGWETPA